VFKQTKNSTNTVNSIEMIAH